MEVLLPQSLAERTRWAVPPRKPWEGEFVLYWMHHAVRGHQNPALDVAMQLASDQQRPLLVYHGLCEEYPFASDRHHTFMIQGARDVQRELADRGIRYVFHLQRDHHRGPHLRDLTRRATVLVTEEMPLVPIVGWLERLQASANTPVCVVDAALVVPSSRLRQKCYTRAFEFRRDAAKHWPEVLAREYVEQTQPCEPFAGPLPFEPLDLQDADLRDLLRTCKIDHTVPPVADTPGGSRAGYARWETFKRSGLRSYAKRRNNAADHAGVSRLSAYLHYGMVSPLRIAQEAAALHAEKFLDELLIWRELAFHFCLHHHDLVNSLDAVPDWARQTLQAHVSDPRADHHSWEQLARAQTESLLWDACQRSLLKHGELHNNVRMTWGKAFLQWTRTPDEALQMAIDLNHRYALDGRDPSSYGGLLWCFGQFDRPFVPEQPILGTVRPREVEAHQDRIDLAKYTQIVDRDICHSPPRVAVIGAGIGGLVAARTLADQGLAVTVFDKSRGVGGRMAIRRFEIGNAYDHGAQYFTARDPRFATYVQSWIQDGIAAPWHGRVVQLHAGHVVANKSDIVRYVAVPGMNAIARWIASDLNVVLSTTIQSIEPIESNNNQAWRLVDNTGVHRGDFDIVLSNCPPIQSNQLLHGKTPIAERIQDVNMLPCWTAMMELERSVQLEFDGAFVDHSPLSWICRNDSKPQRPKMDGQQWVLHASSEWSIEHLERPAEDVERLMLDAFCQATRASRTALKCLGVHRWRYALPQSVLSQDCLWDPMTKLGACGDWCAGPRVEGAFLSGAALAGAVLRELTIDRLAPVTTAPAQDSGLLF